MALIHWQPFQEIETLHRQIDRIFDEVFSGINYSIPIPQPRIELEQTDKELILRAEIPGIDDKDLDVYVAPQAVSIAGKIFDGNRIHERSNYQARTHYGFQRIIYLPILVKNEEVNAKFKDGILTLILPKLQGAKSKAIKINLEDTKAALPSFDLPKILDVPVQKA
jgi:HSP20 family protein